VADPGPAHCRVRPNRFTDERTLLVSGPHFVLERIDLPPNSTWSLEAKRETWLLVLKGDAVAGSLDVAVADAVFAQSIPGSHLVSIPILEPPDLASAARSRQGGREALQTSD
jgi:hypothetical protein